MQEHLGADENICEVFEFSSPPIDLNTLWEVIY